MLQKVKQGTVKLLHFPALQVLSHRDFRYLWISSSLWHFARWMEILVLGWLVLELTDSPWQVALVGFYRHVPWFFFGVFGGVIADRLDRRKVMIAAQAINSITTFSMAFLLITDRLQYWHIVAVALIVGFSWAIEWSSRRSFILDLMGRGLLLNAIAIDQTALYAFKILGPLGGGGLIAGVGVWGCYLLLGLVYAASVISLSRIKFRGENIRTRKEPVLRSVTEGVRYVKGHNVILPLFAITIAMNLLVFPYEQFIPVFARDILKVGPVLMGLLGGADGIGAFAGAVVITSQSRFRYRGLAFTLGSLVAGILLIAFAASPWFALSFVLLMAFGLGHSGFGVMQSTIVLTSASDEMRGRAMGILVMMIGMWPLGILLVGALSTPLGVPLAVGVGSLAGTLLVGLVALFSPNLRRQ